MNPAVAVVLGVLVLRESLTWGTVIGFPTVLVGSWLATRGNRKQAPGNREPAAGSAPR